MFDDTRVVRFQFILYHIVSNQTQARKTFNQQSSPVETDEVVNQNESLQFYIFPKFVILNFGIDRDTPIPPEGEVYLNHHY